MDAPLARWGTQIRFLAVGGWNTAFGYGLFVALLFLAKPWGLHYLIVFAVSNVIAVTAAFTCYKLIVFRTRGNWLPEYVRFWTVNGALSLLNFAILPVLAGTLHLGPIVGQAIAVVIVALLSWFGHSRFSFAKKAPES